MNTPLPTVDEYLFFIRYLPCSIPDHIKEYLIFEDENEEETVMSSFETIFDNQYISSLFESQI